MVENTSVQTFLFADLAGFTAMTEAMGDESAAEVATGFCKELEGLAPEHSAQVVKLIGDAVMVRAKDASAAIRFGVMITTRVGDSHLLPSVRVGMHTGPAIERDGDWFGNTVNLAARVSAEASGGEVLLTDRTRQASDEIEGVELRERGRRTLRNVSEPVVLYAALRAGTRAGEGLPIDPVCRMAVDPAHSAGQLLHDGSEYQFCSLGCAAKFAAHPERYLVSNS